MKRLIISQRHLNCLNEEDTINIAAQAKDNSLSSFSTAASDTNTMSDIQKAQNAGDVNLVVNGPNSNDNQPQQVITVGNGDTVQNAIATQGNDELIRNGGSLKINGDGFGESVVFTKKMIEEVRLNKIKKEGRVLTKKELTESFLQEIGDTRDGQLKLGRLARRKASQGDTEGVNDVFRKAQIEVGKHITNPDSEHYLFDPNKETSPETTQYLRAFDDGYQDRKPLKIKKKK